MTHLYLAIEPYQHGWLDVGDGHQLYYEQSGNPLGEPVLFIHGGPGSGCSNKHRQFFDPKFYRIILFDQRGSGQSKPHASLKNNTTQHLIADIERLRQSLNIERWVLFGGSWGATLALLYAQTYPQLVKAMILRGIFLAREQDINWLYQQGASEFYPDYWQDFISPVVENRRNALIEAYYDLLTGKDEVARMRAAEAWSLWEGRTSTLQTKPKTIHYFTDPHVALAMARIECHYFIHKAFIRPNQILEQMDSLKSIPTFIIHGRYDMVCPINQAFALKSKMPHAKFIICGQSGHSAFEPEISRALINSTQTLIEMV